MAAVVTVAEVAHGSIRATVITWTSHTDGSATQAVTIDGQILRVVTNPGATAPTDNYDITFVDADGQDVMEGFLANRDTTNTEVVYPYKEVALTGAVPVALYPLPGCGLVTFTLANAGDTKGGVCTVYWR